jgi:hypothetical protein
MHERAACTQFGPTTFLVTPARAFEDLRAGEMLRTLIDAHASAFQVVSADNHPDLLRRRVS